MLLSRVLAFTACYIAIHISFRRLFLLILTPTSKWNANTRSYLVQINILLPSVWPLRFLTFSPSNSIRRSFFVPCLLLSFFLRFLFVNDFTFKLCAVDTFICLLSLVLFPKMREEKRLKMNGGEHKLKNQERERQRKRRFLCDNAYSVLPCANI